MSRRGATTLAGILPVDKPADMTSHDVVAAVRRATGEGRVGHAGTLDPMATGVLVVLVGPYTRLEPYLSSLRKSYDARIVFGSETDTDDAEGATTATLPVPDALRDPAYASAALARTIGPLMQVPPAYSAIKVGGRVAHRAARAGEDLDLAPRNVEVFEARLIDVDAVAPAWNVAYTVSKGTYVRALARDLGRACGTAAHLGALRRTSSGAIDIAATHDLERTLASARAGALATLFADPLASLGLPTVEVERSRLAHGRSFAIPSEPELADGAAVAVTISGVLAGVYRVHDGVLAPSVVLNAEGVA